MYIICKYIQALFDIRIDMYFSVGDIYKNNFDFIYDIYIVITLNKASQRVKNIKGFLKVIFTLRESWS